MAHENPGTGAPVDPVEGRVHDDNFVLNELKRLLLEHNTIFGDQTVVERKTQIDLSSEYRLSNLNDDFSTGVSHLSNESEYRIRANSSTEHLESLNHLRYNPQFPAQTGISIRIPSLPSADQEVKWGYWNGSDGVYWGLDSTGPYLERQRNGTEQGKVREADWNGTDVDTESILQDGVVAHLDCNLYNNGNIRGQLHPRSDDGSITPTTVHRMAPLGETTLTTQNLPLRVEVRNDATSDYDVFVADRAAAILGQTAAQERTKGHYRVGVDLSGTDWVPLLSFRKKSGFEGTPVETLELTIIPNEDILIQLRSDMPLSSPSWGAPQDVDAGETVVEVDEAGGISSISDGNQRWIDAFVSGQGSQTQLGEESDIDQLLKNTRPMTLLARRAASGVTGGSIQSFATQWKENW